MNMQMQQVDPLDVERKNSIEGKQFINWFQILLLKCKTTLEREVLRKTINPLWGNYREAVKRQREESDNGSNNKIGH